jgi:hypothetical protein
VLSTKGAVVVAKAQQCEKGMWMDAECKQISQFFSFTLEAQFTPGVRANVQPKSSIPIGAKVEISPKGFYTRSQG